LGTPPKINIDTKTDVLENVSLFKNTFLGTYPETNMEKKPETLASQKEMSSSINFQGLNLMGATDIRYPFLVFLAACYEALKHVPSRKVTWTFWYRNKPFGIWENEK